ncbi:MAG: SDR family oxidoreductase [Clostridia bacterium]|nr:SDR family oxidoreductase [Clostridia bacterium]
MIVWVTGASSGLGLHTAEALRAAGHRVIAGARSFATERVENGNAYLPLDVTDPASAEAFATRARALAGSPEALVQCAGVLVLGSCEHTPLEEYRRVMETNFLGMVRMNQLVLPLMRERGGGRIVMFSSINGLLGVPFQSAYTAAKHAVEGYAECLQMEAQAFGVQVCLVEPGDHRSGSSRYRAKVEGMAGTPYADAYRQTIAVIHHDETHGSDPAALGRKVAKALSRRHMPTRLRIASPDQHLAVWLHDLLPGGLNGAILRDYYFNEKKARAYAGEG